MIHPDTIDELSHYLKNRKIAPLHITSRAESDDEVETLSMSRFNRIITYEPEEMIVIVEAGTTLAALEKTLREKNQWIPTLRSDENREQTVGSAIARDHFHPRSRSLGTLRTTILGGTFSTPSGEVFKSGSRVVKSVAGYDIHRSFCGSQGLFGVIIHVTLKTSPLPEIFSHFDTPRTNIEHCSRYHPTIMHDFEDKLFIELSGMREDVTADMNDIRSSGIEHHLISPTDADSRVKEIALRETRRSESDPSAHQLLVKLRRAFDTEGVLV